MSLTILSFQSPISHLYTGFQIPKRFSERLRWRREPSCNNEPRGSNLFDAFRHKERTDLTTGFEGNLLIAQDTLVQFFQIFDLHVCNNTHVV